MDLSWWNLIPTYFDGTAFTLGSFPVRWYGIMYIFAFATGYLTLLHINKKENLGYTKEQFDSLFTWIIAGIIIGAVCYLSIFWASVTAKRHKWDEFLGGSVLCIFACGLAWLVCHYYQII